MGENIEEVRSRLWAHSTVAREGIGERKAMKGIWALRCFALGGFALAYCSSFSTMASAYMIF